MLKTKETILHRLLSDFPGMADVLVEFVGESGKQDALDRLERSFSEGTEEEITARIEREREGILAWAVRGLSESCPTP